MLPSNSGQGPEIRTGFLKDPDTPLTFTAGKTIKITTDYEHKGDEEMISMRCAALQQTYCSMLFQDGST